MHWRRPQVAGGDGRFLPGGPSMLCARALLAAAGLALLHPARPSAEEPALPTYNADIAQTSISGLSSGAFMAVQFGTAWSSIVIGVGAIAGGPFGCSEGSESTALSTCTGGAPAADVASLIEPRRCLGPERRDRRHREPGQAADLSVQRLQRCRRHTPRERRCSMRSMPTIDLAACSIRQRSAPVMRRSPSLTAATVPKTAANTSTGAATIRPASSSSTSMAR